MIIVTAATDDENDDADDNDAIYDEDDEEADEDDKEGTEASCGGGVQRREATCVRADGRALHPAQCAHAPMPTLVQPCEVCAIEVTHASNFETYSVAAQRNYKSAHKSVCKAV